LDKKHGSYPAQQIKPMPYSVEFFLYYADPAKRLISVQDLHSLILAKTGMKNP